MCGRADHAIVHAFKHKRTIHGANAGGLQGCGKTHQDRAWAEQVSAWLSKSRRERVQVRMAVGWALDMLVLGFKGQHVHACSAKGAQISERA